jgi:pantetheine-phosphate adenylyltransferase
LCDKLYVGLAENVEKTGDELFSKEEKLQMLGEITKEFKNVEVVSISGLVTDYAKKHQIDFLIRSLRAFADIEPEVRLALTNRKISGIETVFLIADERYNHISSSLIRELIHNQGRLHEFVPAQIEQQVFKKLKGR